MLKPHQFYAVYAQGYGPVKELELILYLFADGATFMEASHLKKNGAEIIESRTDYQNWQNEEEWASTFGKLEYVLIDNLNVYLTHDLQFYREFAKHFGEFKGIELHKTFYQQLPFYRLFVLDFDYDSGSLNDNRCWTKKPHEYELVKEGIVKFESCKTK